MIPWEDQQENDKKWYANDVNKNIALHLNCDFFTYVYDKYCKSIHNIYFGNAIDIGISNTGGFISVLPGIKRRYGLDTAISYLRSIDMLPLKNKIKYVEGSAEEIPFADKHFHLVIITNALDHVKDMGKCVKEIYRVLADGGYVLFETYLRVKKPHPWTFETWQEARNMFKELNVIEHYEITDNRPFFNRNDMYVAILKKGGDPKLVKENLL